MVTSNPARKNATRRTREEIVPRSPLPNSAPAMQRMPRATMTMLMSISTVGIYTAMGSRSTWRRAMSVIEMFRQLLGFATNLEAFLFGATTKVSLHFV